MRSKFKEFEHVYY